MVDISRVYALAKEKGITNAFIAQKCGRQRAFLTNVKNGKDRINENHLVIIADLLDTTPAYLLGETDIKEKPAAISGDGAKSELDQLVSNLSAKYGADQVAALLSVADRMDASALTDLLRIVNLGPEAVSGLAAIARRILDAPQQ